MPILLIWLGQYLPAISEDVIEPNLQLWQSILVLYVNATANLSDSF